MLALQQMSLKVTREWGSGFLDSRRFQAVFSKKGGIMTRRTLMTGAIGTIIAKRGLSQTSVPSAVTYLAGVMDQAHILYFVYKDADSAANHFAARGRISAAGAEALAPPMQEDYYEPGCEGLTCIRCSFGASQKGQWGGWYLLNGILGGTQLTPGENWGDYPKAGVDLTGATRLRFRAKGASGGEQVQFFCLGVGWDGMLAQSPFPDSSPKIQLNTQLNADWGDYGIDLTGADLSYCLGGFGWGVAGNDNGNKEVVFYVDSVSYDFPRLNEPRFLVSYETQRPKPEVPSDTDPNHVVSRLARNFDLQLRNTAYVYDNAVTLISFLATGDMRRADLLASSFTTAINHDRYFDDGRNRNSYQGGDLLLPPGWNARGRPNTVRMPGFTNPATVVWQEDQFDVSTSVGNAAWICLAMLAHYELTANEDSLTVVKRLADWIRSNFWDERALGGFTAGFEGWEEGAKGVPSDPPCAGTRLGVVGGQCKRLYLATEHNIDLYPVFRRLYRITNDSAYANAAEHAANFVRAMWHERDGGGKFLTGTDEKGVVSWPVSSADEDKIVIPVDIQAWALMALRGDMGRYGSSLEYVEGHHRVDPGYGFKQSVNNRFGDKLWFEGTSQVALAYRLLGRLDKWQALMSALRDAQLAWGNGALPAASEDGLNTGFDLYNPTPDLAASPWLYFRRAHVGATAWFALSGAEQNINPFWLGAPDNLY